MKDKMAGKNILKMHHQASVRRIPVSNIPVRDIRTARKALAENIVNAEIAIADKINVPGKSLVRRIEKIRGDIDSLARLDAFLEEVEI